MHLHIELRPHGRRRREFNELIAEYTTVASRSGFLAMWILLVDPLDWSWLTPKHACQNRCRMISMCLSPLVYWFLAAGTSNKHRESTQKITDLACRTRNNICFWSHVLYHSVTASATRSIWRASINLSTNSLRMPEVRHGSTYLEDSAVVLSHRRISIYTMGYDIQGKGLHEKNDTV